MAEEKKVTHFRIWRKGIKYHYDLKASNGRILLKGDWFLSLEDCIETIFLVKKYAESRENFDIRKSVRSNVIYFVLKSGIGDIIGVSCNYISHTGLDSAIDSVISLVSEANIVDETFEKQF